MAKSENACKIWDILGNYRDFSKDQGSLICEENKEAEATERWVDSPCWRKKRK